MPRTISRKGRLVSLPTTWSDLVDYFQSVGSDAETPTEYNILDPDYAGGADPTGVADSTAAIQAAVDAAEAAGPGSVVYVPPTTAFYNIDGPILVETATIRGDGYGSFIKNTRTTQVVNNDRLCFLLGAMHPNDLPSYTQYAANNVSAGDAVVTTTTAGDAGNFSVGDKIFISTTTDDGGSPAAPIWGEFNRVTAVDSGTGNLTLFYPIETAQTSIQVARMENMTGVTIPQGNAFMADNAKIQNLRVQSVADSWLRRTCMFECEISDIVVEEATESGTEFALVIGNAFSRSIVQRVRGKFGFRCIEVKLASHHSTFRDIQGGYVDTGAAELDLIDIGQGSHMCAFENIRVSAGGWSNDSAGDALSVSSPDVTVRNVRIRGGTYDRGINLESDPTYENRSCTRVAIDDFEISNATADRMVDVGDGNVSANQGRVVNSRFMGTVNTHACRIRGDPVGFTMSSCHFENDTLHWHYAAYTDVLISNCYFGGGTSGNTITDGVTMRGCRSIGNTIADISAA